MLEMIWNSQLIFCLNNIVCFCMWISLSLIISIQEYPIDLIIGTLIWGLMSLNCVELRYLKYVKSLLIVVVVQKNINIKGYRQGLNFVLTRFHVEFLFFYANVIIQFVCNWKPLYLFFSKGFIYTQLPWLNQPMLVMGMCLRLVIFSCISTGLIFFNNQV